MIDDLHKQSNPYIIHFFHSVRLSNPDIKIFQIKSWISVTQEFFIGLDNLFNINIYKIIVRINMLLHKTLRFEKFGDQLPLVLEEK